MNIILHQRYFNKNDGVLCVLDNLIGDTCFMNIGKPIKVDAFKENFVLVDAFVEKGC